MAAPSSAESCRACGAPLDPGASRCWLCDRKPQPDETQIAYIAPRPIEGDRSRTQFSLATLMLVMTLVAVCLGVLMVAPGLGILLILFTIPALVRTMVAGHLHRRVRLPWTASEKVLTFLVSLLAVALIAFAGCVAFFFVCVATVAGNGGPLPVGVGIILSLLVSGALVVWLFWLTRPRSGLGR